MGSSQPPGPALVAAAADADPVTLLVTAWLSARRSENTRAGYARDIGITPPRRPGRAPSWLTWCREQGVHPVTGVTVLHVARYARQLETAGLSPASAARKLAAISSWYAWLARRGHISASPAAGVARPRPGPRTPPAPALTSGQVLALINAADTAPGSQRARTAALTAVLLYAGARLSEVTGADVADLGTSDGPPGAVGHPRRRPTARPCRCPARPQPGSTPTSPAGPARPRPGAVRHPGRPAAVPRRRAADLAPPRRPGGPACRPGPPPGTAHDPALRHGGQLQPLASRHSWLTSRIPGTQGRHRACGAVCPPPGPVRPAAWADASGWCRLRDPDLTPLRAAEVGITPALLQKQGSRQQDGASACHSPVICATPGVARPGPRRGRACGRPCPGQRARPLPATACAPSGRAAASASSASLTTAETDGALPASTRRSAYAARCGSSAHGHADLPITHTRIIRVECPAGRKTLRALALAPARLRRPPVSRVISIVPSTRLACGMGQKAGPGRFRCRQSDGGGRYPAWAMESNQTHASKKDDLGPGRCAPRETKVRAGVP